MDICFRCTLELPLCLYEAIPMCTNNMLLKLRKPIFKYTLNKYHVHWLSSFNISNCQSVLTRNIFKKDIRRLSNTDDKRNQIRWFRQNSHLPLCMLESKTSEVVVLFLPLFRLVLCTSNFFRWAICIRIFFFFNFRHSPARVWEQCFKSLVFKKMGGGGGGCWQ